MDRMKTLVKVKTKSYLYKFKNNKQKSQVTKLLTRLAPIYSRDTN